MSVNYEWYKLVVKENKIDKYLNIILMELNRMSTRDSVQYIDRFQLDPTNETTLLIHINSDYKTSLEDHCKQLSLDISIERAHDIKSNTATEDVMWSAIFFDITNTRHGRSLSKKDLEATMVKVKKVGTLIGIPNLIKEVFCVNTIQPKDTSKIDQYSTGIICFCYGKQYINVVSKSLFNRANLDLYRSIHFASDIQQKQITQWKEKMDYYANMTLGTNDYVEIIGGDNESVQYLCGFIHSIQDDMATVNIELMGTEVPLEIHVDHLKKIED